MEKLWIYLHELLNYGLHVGKYTIHGSYGNDFPDTKCIKSSSIDIDMHDDTKDEFHTHDVCSGAIRLYLTSKSQEVFREG